MSSIDVSPLASLKGIVTHAGSGAILNICSDPKPTPGGAYGDAVILATIFLATPIGDITSDVTYHILNITDSDSVLADNTGIATWARLENGNWVVDMDVTESGGGGAITINNTNIVQYGNVTLMSGVIKVLK